MDIILLVLVLSLDAFVASVAYGNYGIKIPFKSIMIITSICTVSLIISLLLGNFFSSILPLGLSSIISFLILLGIGIYYLCESFVKKCLRRRKERNKRLKLRLFDFSLIIDIYIDETKADIDESKKLNSKEALYLAIALSLDSLAIGFGSGLGNGNILYLVPASFVMNLLALWSGLIVGKFAMEKSQLDLSWLTGVLLILLAVLRLA